MNRRSLPLIALNVSIGLVVAGCTAAYGSMSQTVELTVEGKTETVRTFGGTVGDVLEARDVKVTPVDDVSLDPSRPLKNGDDITVTYAKPLTVSVDGKVSKDTVAASTVGEAIQDLGVEVPVGAAVSEDLDAPLSRDGNELAVSTMKTIGVRADKKTTMVTTNKPLWSDVVKEAGITLGADDVIMTRNQDNKLVESADDHAVPGQPVRVVRVEKVSRTEEMPVDFEVKVEKDADAPQGEVDVVTEGEPGKIRQAVNIVYADGKVLKREVVKTTVLKKPTTQVEKHGTKAPEGGSAGDDTVWDKIAQCESGGNWSINTGNGYYGGLQFSLATWQSVGGPGYPHQQSRETQIKYAKILQARSGWGQWGCAHARFN